MAAEFSNVRKQSQFSCRESWFTPKTMAGKNGISLYQALSEVCKPVLIVLYPFLGVQCWTLT